jgi:hypothetical protein
MPDFGKWRPGLLTGGSFMKLLQNAEEGEGTHITV